MNSVIQGMLVYSFHIYSWPTSLLKQLDGWIRNFVWTDDRLQRKFITVSWKKMCSPIAEGGLGIRPIRAINEATLLKLGWCIVSSSDQCACFLRARFLKKLKPIIHHISSSIWPALRKWILIVMENISWQIGVGTCVNFWTDRWVEDSIVNLLNIPQNVHSLLTASVSDFIVNGLWLIPDALSSRYPALNEIVLQTPLSMDPCEDKIVWTASSSGLLTVK